VAFLQGFLRFTVRKRGELRGKTWWNCGESVAGNDNKSGHEKHASFFEFFFQ
jgi:hypothetical protein